MRKTLLVVIAFLLVLCVPTTALAKAAEPSKSTDDTTTTTGFVVEVVEDTESSTDLLASIYQLVNDESGSVISYFDDAVQQEISGKLPEGTDLTKLQMNELVTIQAFNYTDALGDQSATFSFATSYTVEQKLVAMVAIFNADGTVAQWIALDATVVDGQVVVTFPQSVLEALNSNSAALAILSL